MWPDADMLPIGNLCQKWYSGDMPPRRSRFTKEEVETLVVLWCIARSPLMLGGELDSLTEDELALLTHPDLMRIHRFGLKPAEIVRSDSFIVWETQVDQDRYRAIFNVSEAPCRPGSLVPASTSVQSCLGEVSTSASFLSGNPIPPHGVAHIRYTLEQSLLRTTQGVQVAQ